jgi:lipopolysaccharide export system protein LptA
VASTSSVISTFKTDQKSPVDIESDVLDVNEVSKVANFRGGVKARQGDVSIQAAELIATYSGQAGLMTPATGGDEAAQKAGAQLTKIEAKSKVVITSKDGQEATGEWAIFDTKANTMLMGGPNGVQLKQGPNVSVGTKLRVDMVSGEAFLINDASTVNVPSRVVPGGIAAAPQGAACAPGRQCLLFYPKDLQEQQKQKGESAPSPSPSLATEKKRVPAVPKVSADGWSSGTVATPSATVPAAKTKLPPATN